METLVVIIAFWLILIGAYGAMTLRPRGTPARAQSPALARGLAARPRPTAARRPAGRLAAVVAPAPDGGGLFSEVDLLRAQVERLRTEVLALSAGAPERPRARRQPVAPKADLPRPLRRQLRVARVRRPVHA